MARPLRIEFKGAWYHVMNRGATQQAVFLDDGDRRFFIALLAEVAGRFGAEIHAYCLMDNHYHLMLRTPEGNLARIMRHINGLYTQAYNRRTRRTGALFRGRYQAILVEPDPYWVALSRYIHRRPLEVGLVRSLGSYRWSSYPAYSGRQQAPNWLATDALLTRMGGAHAYRRLVEGGEMNPTIATFYGAKRRGSVLGSERFRARIAHGLRPRREGPALKRRPARGRILKSVANHYGVSVPSLHRPTRGRGVRSPARSVAMYLCQEVGGMRLESIAREFGLSGYASAGATIRNVRQRLKVRACPLHQDLDCISRDLTP
jgi:REP element-mobilizing transposase RayT